MGGDQGGHERHRPHHALRPVPLRTQLAGEVAGFDVDDYIEQRLQVQTDRWTHMALAATQMAFDDADFEPVEQDPYSMSVITASSSGGNEFGQREIQALWGKGPGFVGAYQSIAWFYAATTGQISIRHNLMGPVRRRGRRRAPAGWRRSSTRAARSAAASTRRQRRARGADRPVRADLPDATPAT